MDRRRFIGTVASGLLPAPLAAEAHQAAKVPSNRLPVGQLGR